jgi:hypothetical protein
MKHPQQLINISFTGYIQMLLDILQIPKNKEKHNLKLLFLERGKTN